MPKTTSDAGITFTGTDKNLSKTLDSITGKFDLLWSKLGNMAKGAGQLGGQMTSGLGAALGKGKQLISGFTNAMDGMARQAMSPKIDKPFDALYAGFAKNFGELTVGMKMSAKEAKRLQSVIGGMSHGMNVSLEGTAKHYLAFQQQGVNLAKILGTKGLSGTVKRLIQITSTFGVEGEQLASMASTLTKGFGFTEKRVRGLMGMVFRMGKAFGFGRQAMQQMPGLIKEINDQTAHFLKGASPEEIEKITKSIMKLGIGLQRSLGGSFEDALEMSKNLFTVLTSERKNFTDMFAGVGGAMGDVLKAAATSGGFKDAQKMIFSDPAKFIKLLNDLIKKNTGGMGVRFIALRKRIVGALGGNFGHLMNKMKVGWKDGAAAMSKADKVAAETTKNMKALGEAAAKAFKSGLTAGDAYDRMLKSYQTRVMKLSDPAMSKWIKDQQKGFKTFHDKLDNVVKKGGPLGDLTKRLLLVQRVGMSGLFTGLGNLGPMIGNVVTQIGPLLTAFASLGLGLTMVGRLLLPGGIIMLGMAMFHKGMREKLVAGVQKSFKFLQENIPKWWPQIKEGITDLWSKAVEGVKWLMDVVSPMISHLANAIASVDWGSLVMKVMSFVGRFFRNVWYGLTGQVSAFSDDSTTQGRFETAGVKLVAAIGRGMMQAAGAVLKGVFDFFFDWSGGFSESLSKKGALVGGAFVTAMFFGRTRAIALKGMFWIVARMAAVTASLVAQYAVVAGAAIVTGVKMAAAWLVGLGPVGWAIAGIASVGAALYALSKIFSSEFKSIKKVFSNVANEFVAAWRDATDTVGDVWAKLTGKVELSFDYIGGKSLSTAQGMVANQDEVVKAAINAAQASMGWSAKTANTVDSAMNHIKTVSVSAWADSKGAAIDAARATIMAQKAVVSTTDTSEKAIRKYTSALLKLNAIERQRAAAAPAVGDMTTAQQAQFAKVFPAQRKWMSDMVSQMGIKMTQMTTTVMPRFQRLFETGRKAGLSISDAVTRASQGAIKVLQSRVSRGLARALVREKFGGALTGKTARKEFTKARMQILSLMKSGKLAGRRILDPHGADVLPQLHRAGLLGARGQARRGFKFGGGAPAFTARKFKAKAPSAAAPSGLAPSKRKVVEMGEEARRQVGTLSTEVSNLGAAIRALGGITVVVSGSPSFESFIRAAAQRRGGGGRRLAENMPGENVGAFATGNA